MFLKQEVYVKYSPPQQHVICMCTGSGNRRTGSTHCPLASEPVSGCVCVCVRRPLLHSHFSDIHLIWWFNQITVG